MIDEFIRYCASVKLGAVNTLVTECEPDRGCLEQPLRHFGTPGVE